MCLFEVAARGPEAAFTSTQFVHSILASPQPYFVQLGQDGRVAAEQRRKRNADCSGDTMKQTIIQEWFAGELQSWSVIIIS